MLSFVSQYKSDLCRLVSDINVEIVESIIAEIDRCNNSKSHIYIIGNGGSAATASHMKNDLETGLKRNGGMSLDILSLCDNASVLTALANDVGYENIFYSQIEGKISKDDLLIAISCSGNSENIIKSVEYARNIGVKIVGLTGFDGGSLKALSDINYHIQTEQGEYGLVEDMHMSLNHMLYTYYIKMNKNG